MAIQWSDNLSVSVAEIDEQHKIFIKLLNDIYKMTFTGSNQDEAAGLLKQLESYAAFHFATEEKYFDKFKYDRADEHKAEHRSLSNKIIQFKTRFVSEGAAVLPEIVDFMEDWLADHLEVQDKKYSKFFNDNGLV